MPRKHTGKATKAERRRDAQRRARLDAGPKPNRRDRGSKITGPQLQAGQRTAHRPKWGDNR